MSKTKAKLKSAGQGQDQPSARLGMGIPTSLNATFGSVNGETNVGVSTESGPRLYGYTTSEQTLNTANSLEDVSEENYREGWYSCPWQLELISLCRTLFLIIYFSKVLRHTLASPFLSRIMGGNTFRKRWLTGITEVGKRQTNSALFRVLKLRFVSQVIQAL